MLNHFVVPRTQAASAVSPSSKKVPAQNRARTMQARRPQVLFCAIGNSFDWRLVAVGTLSLIISASEKSVSTRANIASCFSRWKPAGENRSRSQLDCHSRWSDTGAYGTATKRSQHGSQVITTSKKKNGKLIIVLLYVILELNLVRWERRAKKQQIAEEPPCAEEELCPLVKE